MMNLQFHHLQSPCGQVMEPDLPRAFTAVELKSYNAILAPPIYQKRLAAVEAN